MTTGHNINASRPYGHSMYKMARETSAELADISCCGQRRDFLAGLGNCNDERVYASEGKKHVGVRAAHEEHQHAYLTSLLVLLHLSAC